MNVLCSGHADVHVPARRVGKVLRLAAHARFVAVLLAIALQAMGALPASAEPGSAASNAANSAAMFKLQSSVQRLTQENAELQARLEARDAELAALRAAKAAPGPSASVAPQRDTAQAQVAEVAARYQQNVDNLNTSLDRARAQIAEIAGKYRELVTTLRTVESDRARVAQVGERHAERARACEVQNAALRDIALQAIDSYEDKGVWDAMLAAEPFTQVQRARLENQVDEYRQKVDALYADVGGVPASTAAAATPATRGGPGTGGGPLAPGDAPVGVEGDAAVEDYPVPDAEAPAAGPAVAPAPEASGARP